MERKFKNQYLFTEVEAFCVRGKVTSLQMVIAAMKLKDAYPLEEKL